MRGVRSPTEKRLEEIKSDRVREARSGAQVGEAKSEEEEGGMGEYKMMDRGKRGFLV